MIWGPDGQEYGTAAQLAHRFRVSLWTIYKWRSLYGLTTVRIGRLNYSPVLEAAAIDRDRRDETRGAPRWLDHAAA